MIFKIALRLRDMYVFTWQTLKILNVFVILTLKQVFWKTKPFFKKLGYRFLLESTKIANATFPYQTALPKSNVKTNNMGGGGWGWGGGTKLTFSQRTEFSQ